VSRATSVAALDKIITRGDLAELTPAERIGYYKSVCDSMGLNPSTRPFEFITLNHKLTMYAKKDATDQLRKLHGVSITITNIDQSDPSRIIVSVRAADATGRTDEDVGVVIIKDRGADDPSNALMKAITKAKRRVTLSFCGLGWLDESEIETIPAARLERVDPETGEVLQLHAAPVRNEAEASADIRDRAFAALEKAQHEREQLDKWHVQVQKYKEKGALTVDDTSALLNAYTMALSLLNGSEA
jgi:hypothetical protein